MAKNKVRTSLSMLGIVIGVASVITMVAMGQGTKSKVEQEIAALGDDWRRYAAVTSNVPFAAIATGRNQFKPGEIGWLKPVVALALYVLILWQHTNLFGAHPLFYL